MNRSSRPFPEVMRALRHVGVPNRDAQQQALHTRWFHPMLSARVAAQQCDEPHQQASCFQSNRLDAAYRAVIRDVAQQQVGDNSPAMRALEARIEAAAVPVFDALAALHEAERQHLAGPGPVSETGWAGWLDALRATLVAIDDAFPDVVMVVVTPRQ